MDLERVKSLVCLIAEVIDDLVEALGIDDGESFDDDSEDGEEDSDDDPESDHGKDKA